MMLFLASHATNNNGTQAILLNLVLSGSAVNIYCVQKKTIAVLKSLQFTKRIKTSADWLEKHFDLRGKLSSTVWGKCTP